MATRLFCSLSSSASGLGPNLLLECVEMIIRRLAKAIRLVGTLLYPIAVLIIFVGNKFVSDPPAFAVAGRQRPSSVVSSLGRWLLLGPRRLSVARLRMRRRGGIFSTCRCRFLFLLRGRGGAAGGR